MYEKLDEYLLFLRNTYNLNIKYKIYENIDVVVFDVDDTFCNFFAEYKIKIIYDSRVEINNFLIDIKEITIGEGCFESYLEKLKTAMEITEKLNKFISFYFF